MLHTIVREQKLPITPRQAWNFISSPLNLKLITPAHMEFHILSELKEDEKIYAGMLIEYTVKPILKIPIHWVTEITHVQEPHYFVDVQRKGPYAMWHHKHFLETIPGGVLMKDIVHYRLPLEFIGRIGNSILVKHQLREIFDYRFRKLEELFGKFIE